ncbi:MAG TPA: hypothetical protein VF021_04690 [Longimicrobiales bacterium]
MKRVSLAVLFAVCCATPLLAQEKAADAQAAPKAVLPAGWQARFDRENADASKVSFAAMGDGLHATSGPAAIYWRSKDTMSGPFKITATFTQMKAPTHPEAYGIFVGGKDLNKDTQTYGYLIVRGDGKYMIKHRAGAEVHTVQDWTDLPALKKADENGKATNTVSFEVRPDSVRAFVNGEQVKSWASGYWTGNGIAGLRVNHNLDVHISNFAITPLK